MSNEEVVERVVGGVDEERRVKDRKDERFRVERDDLERVGEGEGLVAREEA